MQNRTQVWGQTTRNKSQIDINSVCTRKIYTSYIYIYIPSGYIKCGSKRVNIPLKERWVRTAGVRSFFAAIFFFSRERFLRRVLLLSVVTSNSSTYSTEGSRPAPFRKHTPCSVRYRRNFFHVRGKKSRAEKRSHLCSANSKLFIVYEVYNPFGAQLHQKRAHASNCSSFLASWPKSFRADIYQFLICVIYDSMAHSLPGGRRGAV